MTQADVLKRYERLREIANYDLTDPDLRTELDALASTTGSRLNQPISLVSVMLNDAELILGGEGVTGWVSEVRGIPAEWTFCRRVIVTGEPYTVADAAHHPDWADGPAVAGGAVCYAGVPLRTPSGEVIGAVCVMGPSAHEFDGEEVAQLRDLAEAALAIMERHRVAGSAPNRHTS